MSRVAALHGDPRPRHRPATRVRASALGVEGAPCPSASAACLSLVEDHPTPQPERDSEATPRVWIAQFLYPGAEGETRLAVRKIKALDRDSAEAVALRAAPKGEFVLTLVPESDDQFLGQVRHRVLAAKAKRS